MNKLYMTKMIQERSVTTLVVFFVGLAGAMVFLFPILTEEVDARTKAKVQLLAADGQFKNVKYHLDAGKFIKKPVITSKTIEWVTAGTGIISGDEKIRFEADITGRSSDGGHVTFGYSNPTSTKNSCHVNADQRLVKATCNIPSHGDTVDADFEFRKLNNSD